MSGLLRLIGPDEPSPPTVRFWQSGSVSVPSVSALRVLSDPGSIPLISAYAAMSLFTYTNPLTHDPSMAMRDHFILRVGDVWYLTGTAAPYWSGQSPGVRLFVSRDLVQWDFRGWLIDASTLPDDCFYKGRFWAPEIHAAHGRFWLTVNSGRVHPGDPRGLQHHNIVLFVADQVEGPYELAGRNQHLTTGFKNDASLFTDEDGRSYLYCSGGGLWQSEIDLPKGQLLGGNGEVEPIIRPTDPGVPEWMIGGIEGPFVIKRHDYYWMFFSAWTRGYEVGVMRATHPRGPWKLHPREPIFGTRKRAYREPQAKADGYAYINYIDTPDPYAETGHGALFNGPDGTDWFCCHYLVAGRESVIQDGIRQYTDTTPQLGIEPVRFVNGQFTIAGPTWTAQSVKY